MMSMFNIRLVPLVVRLPTKVSKATLASVAKDCRYKGKVRLVQCPIERMQDVLDHQRRSFYDTEPMNIALGIRNHPEALQKLVSYCKMTVAEGISMVALNEVDKLVGAHISGTLYPGNMEKTLAEVSPHPDDPFEKIMYFLAKANVEVKLFDRYDVDKIYEIRMASMDKEYIELNVGAEALLLDEQIARESGFKLIKTEASSISSAYILTQMGYEILSETSYGGVLDRDGKVMIPCQAPNDSMLILVKRLD